MKPVISIIIPMHNAEKYIYKNIVSILNQSYSNFELIIVNDGSTDKSLDIVNSFKDDRITIYTTINQGVSAARNYGIHVSNGDYLFFADADDYVEPNILEKFIDIVNLYNPDLIVCGIFSETFKNSGYDMLCYDEKYYPTRKDFKKDIITLYDHDLLYNVWNKLFKKSIIQRYNVVFPDINFGEDCFFNQAYLMHCNSFYNIDNCLYHYVREIKYSITTDYISNFFDIRLEENDKFIIFFKSYGVNEKKYSKFLSKRFIERTFGCLENLHRRNDLSCVEVYRETDRIIHNKITLDYLKTYHTDNFKLKVILFTYKFKSPFLAYIMGFFLHFFKSILPNAFNKSKNRR